MVRKDFDEIDEADLRALCDTSREEDDRLELKQSFTGGADLESMIDAARERATEGIAREVVAFLNGKGGDLIIGVSEDGGRAKALVPIERASDAAERLRRSLATRIEPTPRAMRIRSIPAISLENGSGYILIRSDSSLQAPHRLAKSKEFYLRRGTEASPMNIREVHDLAISSRTAAARVEERLRNELASIAKSQANNRIFHGGGFQFRVVYVPLEAQQIPLEGATLRALANKVPPYFVGQREKQNDVAFRILPGSWRPVLRGKLTDRSRDGDLKSQAGYAGKRVHSDGTVVFDWFCRYLPEGANTAALHYEWFQGFLAEICHNLTALWDANVGFGPGMIGVAIRSEPHTGNLPQLILGASMFADEFAFPELERVHELPYFAVNEKADFDAFFIQAQEDLLAIAGTEGEPATLSRRPPQTAQ